MKYADGAPFDTGQIPFNSTLKSRTKKQSFRVEHRQQPRGTVHRLPWAWSTPLSSYNKMRCDVCVCVAVLLTYVSIECNTFFIWFIAKNQKLINWILNYIWSVCVAWLVAFWLTDHHKAQHFECGRQKNVRRNVRTRKMLSFSCLFFTLLFLLFG